MLRIAVSLILVTLGGFVAGRMTAPKVEIAIQQATAPRYVDNMPIMWLGPDQSLDLVCRGSHCLPDAFNNSRGPEGGAP